MGGRQSSTSGTISSQSTADDVARIHTEKSGADLAGRVFIVTVRCVVHDNYSAFLPTPTQTGLTGGAGDPAIFFDESQKYVFWGVLGKSTPPPPEIRLPTQTRSGISYFS